MLAVRRLLLPEVFLGLRLFLRLCAMCITCHIGLPFSSADSSRRPAPDSYEHKAICTSQSGQTSDSPHSALSQDGMTRVNIEKDVLTIGDTAFDRLWYKYPG